MHAKTVLNSKGEYNRCQLPRLRVKMGVRDVADEVEIKEMTEADIFTSIFEDRKRKKEKKKEHHHQARNNRKTKTRKKVSSKRVRKVSSYYEHDDEDLEKKSS